MSSPRKSRERSDSTSATPSSKNSFPERYARVLLHLPDGTQVLGVWTGDKWWADQREVHPARWEPVQSRYTRRAPARKRPKKKPLTAKACK